MADINSKNKMRSARTESLLGKPNVDKIGSGVYGANPSPAFNNYHQSMGKDTLPTKFAESPPPTKTSPNKMRTVGRDSTKKATELGHSTIMKTPNRYRGPFHNKSSK